MAVSPSPIVVDTGPLVAAAFRDDRHHEQCVKLFTHMRQDGIPLIVPPAVVAEVGYLLAAKAGATVEAGFLSSLAVEDFTLAAFTAADAERMAQLVLRYADLPLGTTDASVIALAERLNARQVATIDHRHFTLLP